MSLGFISSFGQRKEGVVVAAAKGAKRRKVESILRKGLLSSAAANSFEYATRNEKEEEEEKGKINTHSPCVCVYTFVG